MPHSWLAFINSVQQGTSFIAPLPTCGQNHLCIILNVFDKLSEDSIIYYVYSTSQDSIRQFYYTDRDALVELEESEMIPYFPNGHRDSWIGCGKRHLQKMQLRDLKLLHQNGQIFALHGVFHKFNIIANAITNSETHDPDDLDLFLSGYNPF